MLIEAKLKFNVFGKHDVAKYLILNNGLSYHSVLIIHKNTFNSINW